MRVLRVTRSAPVLRDPVQIPMWMWIVSAYSQFLQNSRYFLHHVVIFSIERRVHTSMRKQMCQRWSPQLEISQFNSHSGLERGCHQPLTEICDRHLVPTEELTTE